MTSPAPPHCGATGRERGRLRPADANGICSRRGLILGGSAAVTAGVVGVTWGKRLRPERAAVFIARHQHYDGPLVRTIRDGLMASGVDLSELRGKRVLLKPNLVEPTHQAPFITTHPRVVASAAEVFLACGAEVTVGEGPGHVRDTEMAVTESGLQEMLDFLHLPFADLNYEEVGWVANRARTSSLRGFHFPRTVLEADLIVSMAKMKTHHWVGVTASLKNLFGVIPGIKYGWPKNVLHHAGIAQSVVDINAALPKTIAIVDGIQCMEGDGPVMGTARNMGLLVIGANPTAVDATVCRLMQVNPDAVEYLQLAASRLGPVADRLITQRGEAWQPLAAPFRLVDKPHLRPLRARPAACPAGLCVTE